MIDKFWEGVTGRLADEWGARILSPALVFWAGGLLAWLWSSPTGWPAAFTRWGQTLEQLPTSGQVALLVAALLVIAASAAFVEQLTFPILRLLEGYWPRRLSAALVRRRRDKLRDARIRAQALAGSPDGDRRDLIRLQALLRRNPAPGRELPTRLGNLLRASEERPSERYGLDSVTCWPYLWLVLDENTRTELTAARATLNGAARLWLWSVSFAVWTPWAWWALPVALAGASTAYYIVALSAAETYGSLVEAAFALHRQHLYRSLRWPLPAQPRDEKASGEEITLYLLRGIPPDDLVFHEPP